jgi:hypothetical protein
MTKLSNLAFRLALLETLTYKLPKAQVAIHSTAEETKILPSYTNTEELRKKMLVNRQQVNRS